MGAHDGSSEPTGLVHLELNPPPSIRSGDVTFEGVWVRAELDGGRLTVKVSGQAMYMGRTVTQWIALSEDLMPLQAMLQSILNAYESAVRERVLAAAYEAYTVAVNNGESSASTNLESEGD